MNKIILDFDIGWEGNKLGYVMEYVGKVILDRCFRKSFLKWWLFI